MQILQELSNNLPLIAGILGWAVAQTIKVIIDSILSRKFTFKSFFSSGGMPSSHSAFVCALTTVIGHSYGLDSVYFAICATFSMIVMYDAFNVRRSAGEQAKALNRVLEALFKNQVLDTEETLKVILGHSPLQVFAGMALGILIGILSINL